jgi:hypothetical protein
MGPAGDVEDRPYRRDDGQTAEVGDVSVEEIGRRMNHGDVVVTAARPGRQEVHRIELEAG